MWHARTHGGRLEPQVSRSAAKTAPANHEQPPPSRARERRATSALTGPRSAHTRGSPGSPTRGGAAAKVDTESTQNILHMTRAQRDLRGAVHARSCGARH